MFHSYGTRPFHTYETQFSFHAFGTQLSYSMPMERRYSISMECGMAQHCSLGINPGRKTCFNKFPNFWKFTKIQKTQNFKKCPERNELNA
jgi:hypothetical protein